MREKIKAFFKKLNMDFWMKFFCYLAGLTVSFTVAIIGQYVEARIALSKLTDSAEILYMYRGLDKLLLVIVISVGIGIVFWLCSSFFGYMSCFKKKEEDSVEESLVEKEEM